VNATRDRKTLDEVHRLLSTVRDGWAQIGGGAGAKV